MNSIYGLYDPRVPSVIMYVGKGLQKRAQSHWKNFLRCGKGQNALQTHWFEKLKAEEIEPAWRFLEENVENWQEAEKTWIAGFRIINPDLCNVADGGNEWPGWCASLGGKLGGNKKAREVFAKAPESIRREAFRKGGKIGGAAQVRWANENPEKAFENRSNAGKIGGPAGAAVMNAKRESWCNEVYGQKLSQVLTGRKITWKEKISAALKGKKFTAQHRENIRQAIAARKEKDGKA